MTTTYRAPPDIDGSKNQPSKPYRVLRAVFWNDDQQRARTPWLILLPMLGAYGALIGVEMGTADSGLALPVRFLLWNVAAVGAAIALILVSRRYLGGRRLVDYGLVVDRRWRLDLLAGLGIGIAAVAIPFLVGIGVGWLEVAAVFDPGELALLPGIAVVGFGLIWVSLWEELTMRGVFLCNAADGFRRWLSPHRAIAAAVALSGLVFGLAHIAQAGHPVLILTWVLAGVVLGGIYVLSGSLALPIGVHITVNIAYQTLFVRTDSAGSESWSAVTRIDVDPSLAFLQAGGVIDVGVWVSLGLLSVAWLRYSRGQVSVDLAALKLEPRPEPAAPDAAAIST